MERFISHQGVNQFMAMHVSTETWNKLCRRTFSTEIFWKIAMMITKINYLKKFGQECVITLGKKNNSLKFVNINALLSYFSILSFDWSLGIFFCFNKYLRLLLATLVFSSLSSINICLLSFSFVFNFFQWLFDGHSSSFQ